MREYREAARAFAEEALPQAAASALPLGELTLEAARAAGLVRRPSPETVARLAQASARLLELLSSNRQQVLELLGRQLIRQADDMLDGMVRAGLISREQADAWSSDARRVAAWAQQVARQVLQFLEAAHRQRFTAVQGGGVNVQAGLGVNGSAAAYVEVSGIGMPTEAGFAWAVGGSAGINAEAAASALVQFYWQGAGALEGAAFTLSIGAGTVLGAGMDIQLIFSVGEEPPPRPIGLGVGLSVEAGTPGEVNAGLAWGGRIPVVQLDDRD